MKKTILVTGANGQLGSELKIVSEKFPIYNFIFTDRKILDITNEKNVQSFFAENKIDAIINAAAYTAVDKAESDKENAILGNATSVEYLAKICAEKNIFLMHISTDYVFNGNNMHPYQPHEKTEPLGIYGYSKWLGEEILKKYFTEKKLETTVVRTSWVYSSIGNNFVKTMLRLMNERPEIKVVNDQIGRPTYAFDLAFGLMKMMDRFFIDENFFNQSTLPIYHFANEGVISWYDFACEIAKEIEYKGVIHPIATSGYPTPAKRPSYSVLDTMSFEKEFDFEIRNWKIALDDCMKKINPNLIKVEK
jgi:dTDP-4-dehydrorhamnose reductase